MLGLTPLPAASLALIVCLAQPALANKFEGIYGWQGGDEVKIRSTGPGEYFADFNASIPGCIAIMTGAGRVSKNVLYIVDDFEGSCTLEIVRTRRGIHIEEGESCHSFHGFKCSFSGDYFKAGTP